MPIVVITPTESEKYSENLFPYASTLNNRPTIVQTAGGSNFDYFQTIKYNRLNSIRAIFTDTITNTFNLGSSLTFTAPSDGSYLLSFRLFVPTEFEPNEVNGKLATFVNSAGSDFDFATTDNGFVYGTWNTFTQLIQLEQNDLFEAEIKIGTDEIGTRAYLGGFKAELDDRGLGLPSRYTEPYNDERITGWQQITDSTYTVGSPLSILEGVTGKILTGTVTEINTQLPTGVTTFWNGTTDKIVGVNNGDAFTLSLRFKAKMDVVSGYFDVGINIGGSLNVISQETLVFTRGANTEQRFDIDLSYFTGTTFIANGGIIEVTPINGDIEIYDIVLVIIRTHKGI
jgi:hypothetical protein